MRFTKLLIPPLLAGLTGCSATTAQRVPALLERPTPHCRARLTEALTELTGVAHPRISNTPFSKSSLLILTNRPHRMMPGNDPLAGVIGSEQAVRLMKEGGRCLVVLLDAQGVPLREAELPGCDCSALESE